MDIERLKELRDYLRVANELSVLNDDNLMQRIVDNNDVTNTIDIAIELLNAEIARQSATREDAFPSAIKWTGKNLREVIDLTGWNESASSKWTWAEYEQVVEEKGLKIFTPSGSVMADIGDWIIYNGKDYYVTAQKNKSATSEDVAEAIDILTDWDNENVGNYIDSDMKFAVPLAITALQAYQPKGE